MYDPAIARFMVMDPMADFVNYQSPFVASDNNPVLYRDEYGLGILNVIGNLFRRAVTGVKQIVSGKNCNCGGKEESIADSFRRPDFGWYKSDKGSGRSYSRSKNSSNNNDGGGRGPVVAIDLPDFSFEPPTVNLTSLPVYNTSTNDGIDPEYKKIASSRSITKKIPFVSSSNTRINNASSDKFLDDIVKTLDAYPQMKILILGNASSNANNTVNTGARFNGINANFGVLMLARARAIESYLKSKGVDPSRLAVGTGTISPGNATTTFIIKN